MYVLPWLNKCVSGYIDMCVCVGVLCQAYTSLNYSVNGYCYVYMQWASGSCKSHCVTFWQQHIQQKKVTTTRAQLDGYNGWKEMALINT